MSNPNLSELGSMIWVNSECDLGNDIILSSKNALLDEVQQVKPWTPTKCVDLVCGWKGPAGKTINRIGSSIGGCPRCGLPCKMNPVTTGNTTDEGEGSNT